MILTKRTAGPTTKASSWALSSSCTAPRHPPARVSRARTAPTAPTAPPPTPPTTWSRRRASPKRPSRSCPTRTRTSSANRATRTTATATPRSSRASSSATCAFCTASRRTRSSRRSSGPMPTVSGRMIAVRIRTSSGRAGRGLLSRSMPPRIVRRWGRWLLLLGCRLVVPFLKIKKGLLFFWIYILFGLGWVYIHIYTGLDGAHRFADAWIDSCLP